MGRSNIKQVTGKKLLEFYQKLFEGTSTNYGYLGATHSFSCIQYKELWLPLPFINIIETYPMRKSMGKIQTSQCYKNYSRMDVTRFDHMIFAQSIGVDLLAILEENGFEIDNETKIAFLVFLLTHDIGHGPFSHPFEQMVDGYKGMHEDIGARALTEIPEVSNTLESIYPGLTDRVVNFKEYDRYGLYALLEGIFDLDRAAFLIMDTYLMDGEEKTNDYYAVLESIYKIFNNIVLKDGKAYIKFEAFDAVDTFIRVRKENYTGVYQSPNRVLSDLVLKRLGVRVLEYSNTFEYEKKIKRLPVAIAREIEEFISFIKEMKEKKADIDLSLYYNFEDRDFDRIFNFLLLFDNPDISRDCFVMIASNDMNSKYYKIDRNLDRTGSEEFYVNNVVKIYKSTPDENITFVKEDGSTIDYKDCEGRFTNELQVSEVLSFTYRDNVKLDNEYEIRNALVKELNDLVLKEEYGIYFLEPRPGYIADNEIINQLKLYVASLKEGLSLEEYCELNGMTKHEILCYLLMYGNNDRIRDICLVLLCDNMSSLSDYFSLVSSSPVKEDSVKLKKELSN